MTRNGQFNSYPIYTVQLLKIKMAKAYRFVEAKMVNNSLTQHQWEELKRALTSEKEKQAKVSRRIITVEDDGLNELSITNQDNGKVISFRYNPDLPCIHYVTPKGSHGHFGFRVSSDGTVAQIMYDAIPKFIGEIVLLSFQRIIK